MTRLITFDPGGITGWCVHVIESGLLVSGELDSPRHHRELWKHLHDISPDTLIYERFDYHGGLAHAELISRDYCGVIDLYGQLYNKPVIQQSPSQMEFWDDEKLKKARLYKPGLPHANDATRHMLYYVTFTLNQPQFLESQRPSSAPQ